MRTPLDVAVPRSFLFPDSPAPLARRANLELDDPIAIHLSGNSCKKSPSRAVISYR